jgi:hypothetical protein
MGTLYKIIKETKIQYKVCQPPDCPTETIILKVGDTFVGGTDPNFPPDKNVYTTRDFKEPDFRLVGGTLVAVPRENIEETSILGGDLSTGKKWAWVIGLTLAAWGLLYWSQTQSNK